MDAYEVHKRVVEVLRADLADGALKDLATYQARFVGHDAVVEAEYRAVTGEALESRPTLDIAQLAAHHQHRYVTRGEIARGSMGAIFHVRDEILERDLAMKLMLGPEGDVAQGSTWDDEPLARRFLDEAKITAQLDHPGVVPVHELGADDEGRVFFTMKKVQGKTLQEVFESAWAGDSTWTRNRVLRVFVRVLETLAFAHEKGIVHRDLKPANVMVGDFGEVYVMDWGLAKVMGTPARRTREHMPVDPRRTAVGQILGTPAYMAPEQARSADVDGRADAYAVGAMLYEFLSRRHPYAECGGSTLPHRIVLDLLRGPPMRLEEVDVQTPAELAAIVDKAMAREPGERYGSALDFAGDLTNCVEGRVVEAHRTGTWIEFRKWVARNGALSAALGAALLFLVVGFITATALGLRAQWAGERAVKENEVSRRQAYLANIAAAVAELDQQDVAAVRLRLERAPPDLRGWEWRYLHSHLDESLFVIDAISHAFREGSDRLLTLDRQGVVRAWDLDRGESTEVLVTGEASDAAWLTIDGRYHLVASNDPDQEGQVRLRVRALDAPEVVHEIQCDAPGFGIPNWAGSLGREGWRRHTRMPLFCYNDSNEALTFHDVITGEIVKPDLPRPAGICGAAPDGHVLFLDTVDDGEVQLFDIQSMQVLHSFPCPRQSRVVAACWTPDATRIITAGADRIVRMLDATTGEPTGWREVSGHSEIVSALAIHPEGTLLATGSKDHLILLRNLETGKLRTVYHGHEHSVSTLSFSPNGRYLVSTGVDGRVRVWSASGDEFSVLRGHASYVYAVAFSPDGRRIYSGGWDGYAGASGPIRVWDAASGDPIAAFGGRDRCVFALALTSDGRRLVTTGGQREQRWAGGAICVWDTATGKLLHHHPGAFRRVALCQDETRILGTDRSGVVTILDLETGEVVGRLDETTADSMEATPTCSPDGRFIARKDEDDRTFSVWDGKTRAKLSTFRGHTDWIRALAFDPDSRRIVSASADHTARVWDVDTGRELAVLAGHGASVLTASFGPSGTYILTGGRDGNLRIWDATSYDEVVRLSGHESYVIDAAVSPDGETIATASGDSTVRLWGTASLRERHHERSLRRRLAAALEQKVEALFKRHDAPEAVVGALEAEASLGEREREVALQLALAKAVATH